MRQRNRILLLLAFLLVVYLATIPARRKGDLERKVKSCTALASAVVQHKRENGTWPESLSPIGSLDSETEDDIHRWDARGDLIYYLRPNGEPSLEILISPRFSLLGFGIDSYLYDWERGNWEFVDRETSF